jgi:M6 family metalloprotease-like protein
MKSRTRVVSLVALFALAAGGAAYATIPPKQGVKWPKSYEDRRAMAPAARPAFTYRRALLSVTRRIQQNRQRLLRGELTPEAASAAPGGTSVSGTRRIPVLMSRFSNTAAAPYPEGNLQKELFDGPWPTGTMTEFYKEMSYGAFTVTGTVSPWQALPQADTVYEGGANCNGICGSSKVGDFLKDTLDANDTGVDFGLYDNDGPDGVPNSGDDDGFVDFVAFVHAEAGGECGNSNIWSHRWSYSGWTNGAYTTADNKTGGGKIKVDDYVIMPALACDNTTMIQIGVFAHEFGHAFGLPDLYDTDPDNGDSEGIGNWCLMAGGSWGGDGQSPDRPVHMSAWSKEFLGWVSPTTVTSELNPASLKSVEDNASVLKVPVSATQWYLIENREKKLFDGKLPAGGLLVWKIDQAVINGGLANNTVNADETRKGVDLEEADGLAHLDAGANRGDAGDPFPGSAVKREFHNTSNPRSAGTNALCAVSDPSDTMTVVVRVADGTCANLPPPTPTPTPSPTATPTPGGGGGGGGSCSGTPVLPGGEGGGGRAAGALSLLTPLVLAGLLLLRRARAEA